MTPSGSDELPEARLKRFIETGGHFSLVRYVGPSVGRRTDDTATFILRMRSR